MPTEHMVKILKMVITKKYRKQTCANKGLKCSENKNNKKKFSDLLISVFTFNFKTLSKVGTF